MARGEAASLLEVDEELIRDLGSGAVFDLHKDINPTKNFVYVDNLGSLCCRAWGAAAGRDATALQLRQSGLVVHEFEQGS